MKNKEEKEEEVALWILAQRTCIKVNKKALRLVKKLSDTPEKIRKPQKMHKLNLNPNSIYIGNWIYKKTTRVNSSQVFKAGRRPFLSIEVNF
jgi:tRNA G10  N-methylase Trm11